MKISFFQVYHLIGSVLNLMSLCTPAESCPHYAIQLLIMQWPTQKLQVSLPFLSASLYHFSPSFCSLSAGCHYQNNTTEWEMMKSDMKLWNVPTHTQRITEEDLTELDPFTEQEKWARLTTQWSFLWEHAQYQRSPLRKIVKNVTSLTKKRYF